tara:strand:- start:524 stop:769 length:246 start_codon:yes stop_codon:yes gene_type:complete
VKIQFDTYSISVNAKEVNILNRLNTPATTVDEFTLEDWVTIDLLWRKHIVVYDKSRTKKPDIQPWAKQNVLNALSNNSSGK